MHNGSLAARCGALFFTTIQAKLLPLTPDRLLAARVALYVFQKKIESVYLDDSFAIRLADPRSQQVAAFT